MPQHFGIDHVSLVQRISQFQTHNLTVWKYSHLQHEINYTVIKSRLLTYLINCVPILLVTLQTATDDDDDDDDESSDDCGACKVLANCKFPCSSVRNILAAAWARLCLDRSLHASSERELSRLSDVFTTACKRRVIHNKKQNTWLSATRR